MTDTSYTENPAAQAIDPNIFAAVTATLEPAPIASTTPQEATVATAHPEFITHSLNMLDYLEQKVNEHNELLTLAGNIRDQFIFLHDNLKKEVVSAPKIINKDVNIVNSTIMYLYKFIKNLLNKK
jgi:hypothetical protein